LPAPPCGKPALQLALGASGALSASRVRKGFTRSQAYFGRSRVPVGKLTTALVAVTLAFDLHVNHRHSVVSPRL